MADEALSYRVEGQGPPLLLVHGFGISYNIWKALAPLLAAEFTLVMPQLPGIGSSPMLRPEAEYTEQCIVGLERLRASLNINRWSVLGYSTGSRITEAYVRACTEHVISAIFLCALRISSSKRRALSLGLWLDQRVPAAGTWILSGWRLRFLIGWLGFNLRPDPRTRLWFDEISAVAVRVLKATIRAVAGPLRRDFDVSVPHIFLWGDEDLVPEKPDPAREQDYFVHGRHAAPLESADEIAAIVKAWLKQHSR